MPTIQGETTKTEFARYLDENENAVPSLKPMLAAYHSRSKGRFGFWLSVKHRTEFSRAYQSWWLKHSELWGTIYV